VKTLTRRSLVGAFAAVPVLTAACRTLAAEKLPKLAVTKDPTCGCCHGWTEHIRAAGFPVEIDETRAVRPCMESDDLIPGCLGRERWS